VLDCAQPHTFLAGLSLGGGVFEIRNFSTSCTGTVQAASYLIPSGDPFDTNLGSQLFFAASATTVGPGQVHTLAVAVPGCAYQADAFMGPLNNPMAGSDMYHGRLLASERGPAGGGGICTPTPTGTQTAIASPTATPTRTATATPGPTGSVTAAAASPASATLTVTGPASVTVTSTVAVGTATTSVSPTLTPSGGTTPTVAATPGSLISIGGGGRAIPLPLIPAINLPAIISGSPAGPFLATLSGVLSGAPSLPAPVSLPTATPVLPAFPSPSSPAGEVPSPPPPTPVLETGVPIMGLAMPPELLPAPPPDLEALSATTAPPAPAGEPASGLDPEGMELVELLHRFWTAVNRGDAMAAAEAFAEDGVRDDPSCQLRPCIGRAEVAASVTRQAAEGVQVTVLAVERAGTTLIARQEVRSDRTREAGIERVLVRTTSEWWNGRLIAMSSERDEADDQSARFTVWLTQTSPSLVGGP
jgi:hypothetical protein